MTCLTVLVKFPDAAIVMLEYENVGCWQGVEDVRAR